jgi:hypothetical protein
MYATRRVGRNYTSGNPLRRVAQRATFVICRKAISERRSALAEPSDFDRDAGDHTSLLFATDEPCADADG